MICPECNHENPAGTTLCPQCGSVLTQTELTASVPHRTNQVWNTEIEKDRNQTNSRAAMIALGAAVLLLLGLITAVCCMLPSIGDSLIGQWERERSFIERIDDFLEFVADTNLDFQTPIPEAYAAIPEGTDREFIELLEDYLEKAYDDDYLDHRRLSERYYEEFNELKNENFTNGDLAVCAAKTVQALDKLRKGSDLTTDLSDESTTHNILWLEGLVELYSAAADLHADYGILYKDPEIADFYIYLLPIYRVQLEVERDLTAQLLFREPQTDDTCDTPYLMYTNHTPYELEITFYNDYETKNAFITEECYFESLKPEETVVIPLREMPAEYENWYVRWFIDSFSIDGIDIYDYDW